MRKQATTSIGCWCDAAGCLGFRHARSRSDAGDAAIATSYRPRSVAPRSHEGDRLDAAHHRRAASIARICTSNIPRLSKLGRQQSRHAAADRRAAAAGGRRSANSKSGFWVLGSECCGSGFRVLCASKSTENPSTLNPEPDSATRARRCAWCRAWGPLPACTTGRTLPGHPPGRHTAGRCRRSCSGST